MRVVVLGIDSYLGCRFAQWITNCTHTEVVGWSLYKSTHTDYDGVAVFGIDKIEHIVHGADIVVNLHEVQDYSLLPDLKSLYSNNVKLVEHLVFLHSLPGHNWKLVHLSTPFLQCSSRWPNVNSSEIPLHEIPPSRPYKSYCDSKLQADNILSQSAIDCIIVRPVPLYGEGDRCSVITDSIKISSVIGFVPQICDEDGVMQMMTLQNAISGIWKATEKLYEAVSDENESTLTERIFEILVLSDNTAKCNFFKNFSHFVQTDENYWPVRRIPFLAIYFIYNMVAFVIRIFSCVYVTPWMKKLPDPDYLYMNFYHWTFFNNYKAKEYLGFSPEEEHVNLQIYYRKLEITEISKFSWENDRDTGDICDFL